MTNTRPAAAPATLMPTAIRASDFSSRTTDFDRHRWTVGKMQLTIDALKGAPVVIVVDQQTGFTMVGVTLTRSYHDSWGGDRVVVRDSFTEHGVAYRLADIGETIIPLTEQRVKWNALNAARDLEAAAIRKAREAHGEGRRWGAWRARPTSSTSAHVTYTPSTGNPAFGGQWGTPWFGEVTVDSAEIARR